MSDFMVGFAQGIPSAIQGYYDAEDRKYRQMEMQARLKAQEENAERQRMRDEMEMAEFSPERRREKMQFELAKAGMEGQFGEDGSFQSARFRPDYIAIKQRMAREMGGGEQVAKALTPAQKKVDEAFAKDYSDFTVGGGYSNVKSNLDTLRSLADEAEKSNVMSGPIAGNVPFKSVFNPKAADAEDRVRAIIFQSLRDTLGAQFTEKEGERLVQTAWNPSLDEKTNAKRLRETLQKIETMAQAKQAAADYYEQFGTLQGYKGPRIENLKRQVIGDDGGTQTASQGLMAPGLMSQQQGLIQPQAGAKPVPASGPKQGTIEDGYRFMGGNPADPKNWKKVK